MATYEGPGMLLISQPRVEDTWITGDTELVNDSVAGGTSPWRGSLRSSDSGQPTAYRGPATLVLTQTDDPTGRGGRQPNEFNPVHIVDVIAAAGVITWKFIGTGTAPF